MTKKEKTTPDSPDNKDKGADTQADGGAQAEEKKEPLAIEPDVIGSLERERDQYLELARRARADYVNLQRRMEAQSETVRDAAKQEFAKDILGVLDDLDKAIEHSREGVDCAGIIDGLEMVRRNFLKALAKNEIEPMEAEGLPFDHNLHHAIAEHPTDDAAPGTVYAVAQKGYTAGGKMLRPAHVVVAKKPEKPEEEE